MIDSNWVRVMARYNRWQNDSIYTAADSLDHVARRADRGAFFRSIHETLNHILWGDSMWMARLAGWDRPAQGIVDSCNLFGDWNELRAARRAFDDRLVAWTGSLADADLAGTLDWHSAAAGRDLSTPYWLCVTHMFNHETHHRGQVHAMLTAAGARPGDTDLPIMPDDQGPAADRQAHTFR